MSASKQESKPISLWVALASVLLAGCLGYLQYPSVPAIWLGLIIAGWTSQSPILTGKKDSRGFATPAHEGEIKRLLRHRFWSELRTRLLPLGKWDLPGWPIRMSTIWSIVGSLVAATFPVGEPLWRIANAAATFLIIMGLTEARRDTVTMSDSCPGVTLSDLRRLLAEKPFSILLSAAFTILASVIIAVFVWPSIDTIHPFVPSVWLLLPLSAVSIFLSLIAYPSNRFGLADWRKLVEVRQEWTPRWQSMKIEPEPNLLETLNLGVVQIDTFEAPAGLGSMAFLNNNQTLKIATTTPSDIRIAILDIPADSANGPVPGTLHPRKFRIVRWSTGLIPDISDPDLEPQIAQLLLGSALAWSLDSIGYARPIVTSIDRITADGSPSVWSASLAFPNGPSLREIRKERGTIEGSLGSSMVAIDHRRGVMFVGADPEEVDVEFDDEVIASLLPELTPGPDEIMRRSLAEDEWDRRWGDILKMTANPPEVQHATERTLVLNETLEVNTIGFVVKQGVDPSEFRGLEPKISTTLRAAPFVAVTGYPNAGPGTRHPQAFRVTWSNDQVPQSPQMIKASPAAELVLAGLINSAFDAAKIARPEVIKATPLGDPSGNRQLWEIRLRLYGGVTASDLRTADRKMQSSLRVDYFRIVATEDRSEVILFIGQHHRDISLKRAERDALRLERIDWDYFFGVAGLVVGGGERPQLVSKEEAGASDSGLFRYVFRYPGGMTFADVKSRIDAIKTASDVSFILPRSVPDKAGEFEILVGERFPIPERVDFDFDIELNGLFVVGQGVMGSPVGWNTNVDPHCLISGSTGSGKSVAIQSIIFCAARAGWKVLIADPTKGGADFGFVEPYSYGFVDTVADTALMLQRVYEEVLERKRLNASNRVGSYRDLPPGLRPVPILVAVDEFFSLVAPVKVPPKTGNPDADALRDQLVRVNFQKAVILDLTGRIAREARSAGAHMVIAAQRPDGKLLEGEMKFNFSARVLMGTASTNDRRVALRSPADAPEIPSGSPKGRGVVEISSGPPELIQGWYASQDDFAACLIETSSPVDDEHRIILRGDSESESVHIPDDDWEIPPPPDDLWGSSPTDNISTPNSGAEVWDPRSDKIPIEPITPSLPHPSDEDGDDLPELTFIVEDVAPLRETDQ